MGDYIGKLIDLTGKTYGDLTVLNRAENATRKSGREIVMWNCLCVCGKKTIIEGSAIRSGHTKSCGCRKEKIKGNKYDLSGEFGVGYDDNGNEFWFDLEDYDLIKNYTWYKNPQGYFCSSLFNKQIRLHRLVMGLTSENYDVDHIMHNLYDNRKQGLRICNHSNNMMNRNKQSNNKTGVTGVYFDNWTKKWRGMIKVNHKTIYLGRFLKKDDAIMARRKAEEKYFGKYSYNNSMEVNNNGK